MASITIRPLRRDESSRAAELHRSSVLGLRSALQRHVSTRPGVLVVFGSVAATFALCSMPAMSLLAVLLFVVFVCTAPRVAVSQIVRACRDHADMYSHYQRDGHRMLVAVADNRVVGTVAVVNVDSTSAEVRRMAVDPAYRRLGIARRLLHAIERHARDHGYRRVVLSTSEVQRAAIKLYESEGYRVCRTKTRSFLPGVPLTGVTISFFEKNLS